MERWAAAEAAVRALVLIGSRVHQGQAAAFAADEFSDWDFQIVTAAPGLFSDRRWTGALGLGEPLAYVARTGRLGTATKVSAVFRDGELDLVILPLWRMRLVRWLMAAGLARRMAGLRIALGGMAAVLQAGHRVLVGAGEWGGFFAQVVAKFAPPRLDDTEILAMAEGFVCDYVSTRKKIERGELIAAQRWLHHQLAEVNLQLLHELRQRRGEPTAPDGRRVEQLNFDSRGLEIGALPVKADLRSAVERSAATLRELMAGLVPDWRWPAL
ncbi:MAG: hypothetical protein HZA93_24875 [Verrucomicrobia bacterium]|nr:hypothetical protein [Verrucomicrobiota bacterium]